MPIPSLGDPIADVEGAATSLAGIATAIAALPDPPLEADLPDIVQIVADLSTATQVVQSVVAQVLTVISTTRIGQPS